METAKTASQAQSAEHHKVAEQLHSQLQDLKSQLDAQLEKTSRLEGAIKEKTDNLEEVGNRLTSAESVLQNKASGNKQSVALLDRWKYLDGSIYDREKSLSIQVRGMD